MEITEVRRSVIAGPEQALKRTEKYVTKNDVTVVLPVLNEEEAVGKVIDELVRCGYNRILVVDGYSTDMTVQIAKAKGVEVISQHGRGKTGAIRTAIDQVSTPYMLVMDGDFTYSAEDIDRFLDHADSHDMIIGVRKGENISRIHRIGNQIITFIFNILFGTSLSDICSGMYLLRTDPAKGLDLHTRGFNAEVEVIAQTASQGDVTEIPIEYRTRVGKQKLSTWVDGSLILTSIFTIARIYNPVFLFSAIGTLAIIPGLAVWLWVLWDWGVTGAFRSGWALLGGILVVLAGQSFAIATTSIMLRRAEVRITKRMKRENQPISVR